MGLIRYAEGDLDKASAQFKSCLKINPGHDYARKALERVKKNAGLPGDAPNPIHALRGGPHGGIISLYAGALFWTQREFLTQGTRARQQRGNQPMDPSV